MNLVSRLLATVGLAVLVGAPPSGVAQAATPGIAAVKEVVAVTFAGVELGRLSVPEFKDLVSQVVAAVASMPEMTPELAASAVTQAVIETLAAGMAVGPSITETIQASVTQSVVDTYAAQGMAVDARTVAHASTVGAATSSSLSGPAGESPTSSTDRDVASNDDPGRRSAY
jgi:hypothetical protein